MKIAIVDDEKRYRNKIRDCIKRNISDVEIRLYESGDAFLQSKEEPELAFIDIEMPGMDGFETIEKGKIFYTETKFIITTTHTELSRSGYKVNAFRYIDKTTMEEEIQEAITSYINIRKDIAFIDVKIEGREYKVSTEKILYIETEKRKVMMTTVKETICCDSNINELYGRLEKYNFYMPFRSSVVNLKYISSFDNNTIIMLDGHKVNLSRRKYQEFKGKYFEYKFNYANM